MVIVEMSLITMIRMIIRSRWIAIITMMMMMKEVMMPYDNIDDVDDDVDEEKPNNFKVCDVHDEKQNDNDKNKANS